MATFNYPFQVTKDTPAVAVEVQTNFDDLLAWLKANFVQADGTVAMTGPLVLAPGVPAAPDHAANKAYVDASMPVGMIVQYAGTTLPTGWLWCDGQTYTNTAQPALASAIGRTYTAAATPANSFQVPDTRKRVIVGADASEAAVFGLGVKNDISQRNSELLTHAHTVPIHGHTSSATGSASVVDINHRHNTSGNTSIDGAHLHGFGHGSAIWYDNGSGIGFALGSGFGAAHATFLQDGNHNHSININSGYMLENNTHGHTITVTPTVNNAAAFNTTNAGAGATLIDKNLQPYIAVNNIIFAGGM